MNFSDFGPAATIAGAFYDQRMNTRAMNRQFDFSQMESEKARQFSAEQAKIDRDMQMEFAKNGIKMRVDDAVRAGLHPLVGAGAQPMSYSPVSVGSSGGGGIPGYSSSTMGQDISRAIAAVQTPAERQAEVLKLQLLRGQVYEQDVRSWALYNEEMRKIRADQNPGVPAGTTETIPVKIESTMKDDKSTVAGEHPVWQLTNVWGNKKMWLPRSQGESPFESLEGFVPQAMTLYKNFWEEGYKQRPFFKWLRGLGADFRSIMRKYNEPIKPYHGVSGGW